LDKWINTYLLHGTNSVKIKGLMGREHKHLLAKNAHQFPMDKNVCNANALKGTQCY